VIVNWTRETRRHTKLDAYRLHGPDRDRNLRMWTLRGGVAVTTFDALRAMSVADGVTLGMLTVDEAHYTKNPAALRTKAVRNWAARKRRVLFLTGTPMENRVEEFRTLVGHLRPEIAAGVSSVDGAVGGTRFRKAVAPVYLRRNQDDVLSELPPRLETEDWVELEGKALLAYREAVYAGNFMAMRRASYAPGNVEDSAKLRRLVEIAGEAIADGHKVVVFSFFRDVLNVVAAALGPKALGPLTGSVTPYARQAMVDEFTARTGPSVLVSQIQAGGVGLNIQAASVVIIAEPQWTPATEEQAIARCHRMGQVRRVDVHRLLTEDSVDQRMLEILRIKADEFNEYARRSDLKDITPDAVDISDLTAAKEAATQAETERRIVEIERKRLRMEEEERKDR
jgi:SNF2 family DNA or RNA helicase